MKRYILPLLLLTATACEKALEVTPYSEFAPDNVLTNENGIKAVLFAAYAEFQNPQPTRFVINDSEVTTDMAYNTGGGENLTLSQLINFTWDPSLGTFQADVWAPAYRSIRNANIVLENIDKANLPDATRKLYVAEAKFLRATAYNFMYSWFGPVPLRTSSTQESQQPRATDAEMRTFIETEMNAAIADLPDPGKEVAFARATKGAALGVLAKYYLNTKQWQKAADASKRIMDFGYYILYPDFSKLFRVENEGNKEMILVHPCKNEQGYGNWFIDGAIPPGFKTSPTIPDYVWTPAMANFATQYRLRTAFVNTFDPKDDRLNLIIKTYINTAGATVNLMTTPDNARSLKYWDNGTLGNHSGTDVPEIRYADILLTRAEALNELNGPTAEALDLINQVRKRAKVDELKLADFATKETLRDHILKERGWEFVSEGKRREDLIRHGKFISEAKNRGIAAAKPEQILFPIPQVEIDANKAAVQNPGY